MDKIDIRTDRRYVAAMMSDVPMFIMRDVNTGAHYSSTGVSGRDMLRFALTDNVAAALKAPDRDTCREVIRQYRHDHEIDESFVVLPIEVSYRILDV